MSTPVPPRPPRVPHIRMTALGRLGTTSPERFSYSINLGKADGTAWQGSGVEGSTYFDDAAADVVAFHGRATSNISTAAVLEEVKFGFIGANGLYTRDAIVVNVADTPGGSQGAPHPPQVACAISLTSARRGATGRGRFFMPMPSIPISAGDLSIPALYQNEIQASAAQFLTALGNQPGFDVVNVRPVIVSSKNYTSVITGVRVGRVLDTIRSRRASLPEFKGLATPV